MQAADVPMPPATPLPDNPAPRAIKRYVATLVAASAGLWYAGFVLVDPVGLLLVVVIAMGMLAKAGAWMKNESAGGLALAVLFGAASGVVLASLLGWLRFLPGGYAVRPTVAMVLLATACMVLPLAWPRLMGRGGLLLALVAIMAWSQGSVGFLGVLTALGAGTLLSWRTQAALGTFAGELPPQHLAMAALTRVFLFWAV